MASLGDLMVRVGADVTDLTSGLDSASGKLGEFSDKSAGAGDAWAQASGKIKDAVPELHEIGEATDKAVESLSHMVEGLLQLTEALVVTEALKEFGEEALSTYANIQKASISLGALTGSSEEAEKAIEALKGIALTDALSFPQLVQAYQRMTAFGFSAEQIPGVMQAIANAAAATDKPFEVVADAVDRMALSGTVASRQLASLGISLNDLGAALGVAATDAAATFKALDTGDRLTVLSKALQKYGDVAKAVAGSISGQWQNLKTQTEFVFESVGQALAPVVTQLMQIISQDVLPFLQGLADGFGRLPTPIKDFAVVLGVVAAAIPTVSLALSGLQKVLMGFEVINVTSWASSFANAIPNIVTAIQNDLIPALTTGETVILRLGQAGVVAAAAFAGWQLGTWLYNNVPLMKQFGDAIGDLILKLPGLESIINRLNGVEEAQENLGKATQALNDKLAVMGNEVVRQAGESLDSFSVRVRQAASEMAATQTATTGLTNEQKALAKAIDAIQQVWSQQQVTLIDAKKNLENVTLAYEGHTASLGQLKAAQDAVDQAQKAINPDYVTAKEVQDALAVATTNLAAGEALLMESYQKSSKPILDVATAQSELLAAQNRQKDAIAGLITAQANLDAQRTAAHPNMVALTAAEDADAEAKGRVQDANKGVASSEADLQAAQKAALQVTKDQQTTDTDYATMLNTLGKGALVGYAEAVANVTAAKARYVDAVSNEITIQAQLDALATAGKQSTTDYANAQGALASAHQRVEQALKDLNATQSVAATSQSALSAATKELYQGQSQLDSLYKDHLTADTKDLQGAVNDLSIARQREKQDATDLIAAENNLAAVKANSTSTQAQLTKATDDARTAREKLGESTKNAAAAEGIIQQEFGLSKTAADILAGSTVSLNEIYKDLGIKSASSLQALANVADTEYQKIAASGTASANVQRDALIKALEAEKAAYIAAGSDLPSEQQKQLDHLLAQQDAFNRAHVDQWMKLYKDIQSISDTFFHDLAAVSIKDLLFGGIDNSGLKQQVSDLESQLSDATAAYQKAQQDIASQMKQAVIDNKTSLDAQLADLQSQLDDKTKAYTDYVTNYKTELADLETASAQKTDQQVQALKDTLSQEEQSYDQFKSDTIQKMADLTAASKDQLDQQLSNLQDQLASQSESYNQFVEDTTTSIARIGEAFQEAVSNKSTDTGRNIADKQTDLTRAQQDTATEIQRLREKETSANKDSTEQQIADLQTALQRKTEDTNTYISRAEASLADFTKEQKEQADQQTADLQEALKRRTDDYTAFVADNKQQQDDDTAAAKKALDTQEMALIAALGQKQVQLSIDQALTQQKIAAVTKTNSDELAKQEAALKAGLDAQTADYQKYRDSIVGYTDPQGTYHEGQFDKVKDASKAALAKQESDLQASLDKQSADYQKYIDGVTGYTDKNGQYHKGQLDTLKDQFKTIWGDIGGLVEDAAGKMLTSMTVSFLTPVTNAITKFLATTIADLIGGKGFGGVAQSIKDVGTAFDKVFSGAPGATPPFVPQGPGLPPAAGTGAGGDAGGAAAGAIGSALTGWIGAIGGIVSAVSGVIGIFQNMHQETSLNAIEHNTRYSMMYLGERADGGILGTLFSVHDELSFGLIVKKIEAMSNEFVNHYSDVSITKLTEISSNTFWAMKKLDEINSKTGKTPTSSSVNVEGTDLTTVITALDNINTTLQFSVGLSPWFQTAFQNINNGIVACSGWLQDIAGNLKSGISTTGGGSTNLAADAFGSLAGFVGTEFSTLYTWLGAALKPLLTQQGGQGLTAAPVLPALPTFTSSTGSSVAAAASGATVDLTGLETYLSAQFASVTAGLASLGGIISTQLMKLGEVTGEIFSNSVGLIVATLKASDQLNAAGMERLLKQEAVLSAQSATALGGIGSTLGHLTDITASDFQALIAATKLSVTVPAVNAPHALAGVSAGASNISSSNSNDLHITITGNTFHGSPATSAKAIGDELIKEMRRRGRQVG